MPELNLTAKTKEEQKIKAYLEKNASSTLADKINNGTKIQKDSKTLLNKKTLADFMKFACDEAKKQAEKGAQSACIDDDVVYGWAVHYFEEDSIEGKLYNEDGTEYKIQPGVTVKAPAATYTPPKPQPKPQLSMFDLLDNSDNSDISTAQSQDEDEDIPEIEEDDEPVQETMHPEIKQVVKAAEERQRAPGSPIYKTYMSIQNKYPDCIIAYRLGDFYEVFGENAKILADKLDLTLTGRDCGLESRVPMVGFPYHIAEAYVTKALQHRLKIALAKSLEDIKTYYNQPDGTKQTVDLETGEIIPQKTETDEPVPTVSNLLSDYTEEPKVDEQLEQEIAAVMGQPEQDEDDDFDIEAFNTSALALLYEKLGDEITLR